MAYSAYSSQLVISYLFSTAAVTRPTAWTAHLYNGGAEITDINYAAQAVAFDVSDPTANQRFEAANSSTLTYPAVDAGVTITAVVVKDQALNTVAVLELNIPRTLDAGDVFAVPAGELVIKGE